MTKLIPSTIFKKNELLYKGYWAGSHISPASATILNETASKDSQEFEIVSVGESFWCKQYFQKYQPHMHTYNFG